jgi:hypothetical protein
MPRRDFKWWVACVFHNMIVHPWLPFADALDEIGFTVIPGAIYMAHDRSAEHLEGGG